MNLNPFEIEESLVLENKTEWDDFCDEYSFGAYDYSYEELVRSISHKVEWKVFGGFKDYQGEFFFIGEDSENKIYFLNSGYGSCSGCDALQACDTYEEMCELRDDLKRKVRKFDSLDEFVGWFNGDGQMEYYSDDDIKHFATQMKDAYNVDLKWRSYWDDEY